MIPLRVAATRKRAIQIDLYACDILRHRRAGRCTVGRVGQWNSLPKLAQVAKRRGCPNRATLGELVMMAGCGGWIWTNNLRVMRTFEYYWPVDSVRFNWHFADWSSFPNLSHCSNEVFCVRPERFELPALCLEVWEFENLTALSSVAYGRMLFSNLSSVGIYGLQELRV
jgi:hypothetical protein